MAEYEKKVRTVLSDNGCSFVRHGKGDHDIWYSPIVNRNISVDGKIKSQIRAKKALQKSQKRVNYRLQKSQICVNIGSMKRKVYDKLLNWKNTRSGECALLIEGARRVGKSYIVEEFAKAEYKSYLIINFFEASDEIKRLFDLYLDDLDFLFSYLSNYYKTQLYNRQSLIIFDEVQFCPRARGAIKRLVADGRYDYIETGSLISIKKNVKDIIIPSEEHHMKMYPMDFEEFLWAMGNDMLIPFIEEFFLAQKPLGQAMHRKVMDYFRLYMIVGGMPQAVREYTKTQDFDRVDEIKREILDLYRDDISKHANGYEMKVKSIFEEIPAQLKKHDRKFRLSSLKKEARFRDYEDALFWLTDAMIINPCYNSTEPSIGLRLNMDRMTLKCYMGDTGLLISHAFDEKGIVTEEIYKRLLFDKLEVNAGMIYENITAQMLAASGNKLYFYSKQSNTDSSMRMEIDFLTAKSTITNRHNISPIEVKSGKNYTLSSIRKFIAKYHEQLHIPYVLHTKDLAVIDNVVYLPIYMAGLL